MHTSRHTGQDLHSTTYRRVPDTGAPLSWDCRKHQHCCHGPPDCGRETQRAQQGRIQTDLLTVAGHPGCSCLSSGEGRRPAARPPGGRRSTALVRKSSQTVAVRPQRRRCPLSRSRRQSRCHKPAATPAAACPPARLPTLTLTLLLAEVQLRARSALTPQLRHPALPQGGLPVPALPRQLCGHLAPAARRAPGCPGWSGGPSLPQAVCLLISLHQGHHIRECNYNRFLLTVSRTFARLCASGRFDPESDPCTSASHCRLQPRNGLSEHHHAPLQATPVSLRPYMQPQRAPSTRAPPAPTSPSAHEKRRDAPPRLSGSPERRARANSSSWLTCAARSAAAAASRSAAAAVARPLRPPPPLPPPPAAACPAC